MWKMAKEKNPIWYFDATGSINKDVISQKKPFFYSLVFHDKKNTSIIPLAEFVTTANDQISVSKYLCSIKNKLEEHSEKNLLAKIIVTDMGWALINAAMLTFNCCNVSNYLNWCFDMLFKPFDIQLKNSIKIKSYLCSTHFLKNIIKKSKTVKVPFKHVTSTFIFMFTLVQNSVSIEQIDKYTKHIHNIFNNPYLDWTVYQSLHIMANAIRNRKLSFLNSDMERTPQQQDRDKYFDRFLIDSNVYISVDYEENIKQNSPFKIYYDNLINKLNIELSEKIKINGLTNCQKNEYYCPQLFSVLEEKLYLIPMWSAIMIKEELESFEISTRLTNNPVENWFGQIKNHILQKLTKRLASVLITLLYARLLSKFYEYYSTSEKTKKPEEKGKLTKLYESWSDKKLKRNKQKGTLKFIFKFFKVDLIINPIHSIFLS